MSKVKGSTLQAMLDDVANDFISALEVKKEALAKSEQLRKDFPPSKDDDSKPEEGSESKPDASASASPSPDASPAPAPEASDAPVAAPDAAAPAPSPDAGMQDPAAEQALDPAALQAEYAKLAPEELDMHLQAAMAAKQALEGAAGPAAPGAPAPDASPAPAAPAPEMKSEPAAAKTPDGSGELEKSVIAKSEAMTKALNDEMTELKKLVKSQSDEIATLQAGIQKAINTPDRKAVTAVSHVTRETAPAAAKEWTKDGIHSHLKTLSASGKLAKSDRDLINDFYCGVVKIDKLAHLFEGK